MDEKEIAQKLTNLNKRISDFEADRKAEKSAARKRGASMQELDDIEVAWERFLRPYADERNSFVNAIETVQGKPTR